MAISYRGFSQIYGCLEQKVSLRKKGGTPVKIVLFFQALESG